MRPSTLAIACFALTMVACGPPRLGSDSTSEDQTGSSTSGTESGPSTAGSSGSSSTSGTEDTDGGELPMTVPVHDDQIVGDCDTFEQNCPEGEKCVPYASFGGSFDASKCVPIMGDQLPGEPCTYGGRFEATDDCDGSSMCWDIQGSSGTCYAFCQGPLEAPECPPTTSCSMSGDGLINLCIPGCDPLLQDCIDDGYACFWANGAFECIWTTQDIPVGEPCGFINDCAGGLVCLGTELFPACNGAACCSPFCNLADGDGPCGVLPGTACVPFSEQSMIPSGYEDVGVCILPPGP